MTLVYEQLLAPTKAKQLANRLPALLDAAAGQFAQHGYHGATIRDVAKAVAMTPGAIYFHFPSKQHLLIAVYEEGVRRILDKLGRSPIDSSSRRHCLGGSAWSDRGSGRRIRGFSDS